MFGSLKKLVGSLRPSFMAAAPAMALPAGGQVLDTPLNLEPAATPDKPTLKQRILNGLPGFATSAGTVIGAKAAATTFLGAQSLGSLATGLLASTSPIALLPAAGAALGVVGVGAFAHQSVAYVRERIATIEKEQNKKVTLKSFVKDFNLAAAGRELKSYGQELTTGKFWKGALKNGTVSATLGAAFGLAVSTETAQHALHKTWETISNFKPLSVVERLATMVSGTAHAAPNALPGAAASVATLSADAVAAITAPDQAIDKVRDLIEAKGKPNIALEKLLVRAENGNLQSVKDVAYGLFNGKLGLPVNRDLSRELYEVAAKGGNAQAIRDLAYINKIMPQTIAAPAAPLAAPLAAAPLPAAAPAPALITAEPAPPAAPAPVAAFDKAAAVPDPKLAGTCDVQVEVTEDGDIDVSSECDNRKVAMVAGDEYAMRTTDGKISKSYVLDGDEGVDTEDFRSDALLNFIRNEVVPTLGMK